MNRREAMQVVAGAAAAAFVSTEGAILSSARAREAAAPPTFSLPPLGYAFDALEPYIDAETMRLHHGTHHAAFVDSLNAIAAANPSIARSPMAKTLDVIETLPDAIRTAVRHNMGGHWNHSFFWNLMTPGGAREPQGQLKAAIEGTFGSVAAMQKVMETTALADFGSGWVWLGTDPQGQLSVFSTPNEDTPHMIPGGRTAVLGVDLWEHAHYLSHDAARGAYLSAWWNMVNWDKAGEAFDGLTS
ncbi:MAG: superoxide dismutase [Hyphomicrobiaceae bacterium]